MKGIPDIFFITLEYRFLIQPKAVFRTRLLKCCWLRHGDKLKCGLWLLSISPKKRDQTSTRSMRKGIRFIFYFRISLTFESFSRTRLHAASFAMATKISWNLALFNFTEKKKTIITLKKTKIFHRRNCNFLTINQWLLLFRRGTKTDENKCFMDYCRQAVVSWFILHSGLMKIVSSLSKMIRNWTVN